MIGRSGERGSGISVLAARHDDDDIYLYIYIYIYAPDQLKAEIHCTSSSSFLVQFVIFKNAFTFGH